MGREPSLVFQNASIPGRVNNFQNSYDAQCQALSFPLCGHWALPESMVPPKPLRLILTQGRKNLRGCRQGFSLLAANLADKESEPPREQASWPKPHRELLAELTLESELACIWV